MPRTPQGGFVDIDITTMYKDELARVQKFFEITPVVVEKKEPPKPPENKVEKYDFPRNKRRY